MPAQSQSPSVVSSELDGAPAKSKETGWRLPGGKELSHEAWKVSHPWIDAEKTEREKEIRRG
jgi:hypothetical protein